MILRQDYGYMNLSAQTTSMISLARKQLAILFLSCALALATTATAQEIRDERAKFSIILLGVNIAYLEIASRNNGKQYAVTSLLDSRGLAKIFVPSTYRVRTRGHVLEDGLVPSRYIEERITDGKVLTKTVTFRNGKLHDVTYDPPKSGDQHDAANSSSGVSHDLLTTMYSISRDRLAGELCDDRIVTFNGSDWSIIEMDEPEFDSSGFATCTALIYSTDDPNRDVVPDKNYEVNFLYGPHTVDEGWYMLNRITAQTRIGKMTVRRRS